jgi:hypothetical protein
MNRPWLILHNDTGWFLDDAADADADTETDADTDTDTDPDTEPEPEWACDSCWRAATLDLCIAPNEPDNETWCYANHGNYLPRPCLARIPHKNPT